MVMARKKPHVVSGNAAKLGEFLCFAIYSANLSISRAYKPLLDELGLTYPQLLVLAALYDEDDRTVGSLGEKLFLDSSTLTPVLKRMERAGYLTRQRDPEDERQVRIRLTQHGRIAREKSFGFLDGLVKDTGLAPARYQQLLEALVKLREKLSNQHAKQ
jgi:MarR family transcriptional regulator, organic hydroperoxide resistance regulator